MSPSPSSDRLIVGTRGSLLARTQTQWVIDRIKAAYPGLDVDMKIITTRGDRQQTEPLPDIGGKGLFTEEIEAALLDGSIDLAVHSVKDLPTDLKEGLGILAYPIREDARDAWVSADGTALRDLSPGSVVGTGSLRRQAQLLMRCEDLHFVQLRGNVDTRIRKVHRGDCAGAVLAMAGLKRVGLTEHVTHPIEPDVMLSAPGQGALGVEGRSDDQRVASYLQAIHDLDTAAAVGCERAILHELDAGCRAPVAAYARIDDDELVCDVLVSDPKGRQHVRVTHTGVRDRSEDLVQTIMADLRSRGADEIIAACRKEWNPPDA